MTPFKINSYYKTSCYYSPFGKITTFIFKVVTINDQYVDILAVDNYLKAFRHYRFALNTTFLASASNASYKDIMFYKYVDYFKNLEE